MSLTIAQIVLSDAGQDSGMLTRADRLSAQLIDEL